MIMMKGLMKKVRGNKKGFTLAELLVVVAIVGILVAISIPVFTAQLSKATNQANLRAAKAAAIAAYLTDEDVTLADKDGKIVYYEYDLDSGTSTKDGALKTDFAAPTTDYSEVTDMDSATDKAKYEHIQVAIKISSDSDSTANGTEVKLDASTKE